jgi:hypothetical protein
MSERPDNLDANTLSINSSNIAQTPGELFVSEPNLLVDKRTGFTLIDASVEEFVNDGIFSIGGAAEFTVSQDGPVFNVNYTVSGA